MTHAVRYDLWELLEPKIFSSKFKVIARKYLPSGEKDPFQDYVNERIVSHKRIIGLPLEYRFYPEMEIPERLKIFKNSNTKETSFFNKIFDLY